MTSRLLLACGLLLCGAPDAADWRPVTPPDPRDTAQDFFYQERTAVLGEDGKRLRAHLAFFNSRAYRLEVVDLGAGDEAAGVRIEDAAERAGCIAGVNGGFFHPDYRPLGLVISGRQRTGRLETTKLLSGVVYSDDRGVHVVRRAAFRDHPSIDALLQTGPFLVEHGRAVRGLSSTRSARRTFIATDWRRHWVIGATTSHVTLAQLADALATPEVLTGWRIDRGINLDGGSSTGFFVRGNNAQPPVTLRPLKRVRNLLCIRPR
jgi:hypothetical protein